MARISKEKQEEIRQKIKDVSRIKFEELGFDNTSTKEIAKEVGIAEGTLFNYFESKTEIFFESFGDDYQYKALNLDEAIQLTNNVTEIIYSHFHRAMGMVMKIPRGIMGELAIASVRMAKRKPERFKKLMAYDFQFIDEISGYVKELSSKGMIEEVDSDKFSEIIFSIIGYELLLYIYDTNIKKDEMTKNIKIKLDILIKGYLKGGQK